MRSTLTLLAGLTIFSLSASTAFAIPLSVTGQPPGTAPIVVSSSSSQALSSSAEMHVAPSVTAGMSASVTARSSSSSAAKILSSSNASVLTIGMKASLVRDIAVSLLDGIQDEDSQTTAAELKIAKKKIEVDFDALATVFADKKVSSSKVNALFNKTGKDLSELGKMIDSESTLTLSNFRALRKNLDRLKRAWTKVRLSAAASAGIADTARTGR